MPFKPGDIVSDKTHEDIFLILQSGEAIRMGAYGKGLDRSSFRIGNHLFDPSSHLHVYSVLGNIFDALEKALEKE